jgi:hypothetical protein
LLVLVGLYQMPHILFWWLWWRFIRWRTFFFVLVAVHWMAQSCVGLAALHYVAHLFSGGGCGGDVGGASSDGTHFCLALVTAQCCGDVAA